MRMKAELGFIVLPVLVLLAVAQDAPAPDSSKTGEVQLVRLLNQKLSDAARARDAGNWEKAIALLKEASELGPDRDLIWFKLGDAYRGAKQYQDAVGAYNRAIALKPIAPYYNNLGEAENKVGNVADAVEAYQAAVRLDPEKAQQYYFNIGAVETNAGNFEAGNAAYDDAIRADPNFPMPYYFKALNLLSDSQTVSGKAVVPGEASRLVQKYLELAPEGPYVETCHQVLAFVGRDIVTSYERENSVEPSSSARSEQGDQNVAEGVTEGFLIRKLQPSYPELARTARIEGTVTFGAIIGAGGNIVSLAVLSGNPFLVEAALDAVKQWKYKPYKLGGHAVSVRTEIRVNFALTPDRPRTSGL